MSSFPQHLHCHVLFWEILDLSHIFRVLLENVGVFISYGQLESCDKNSSCIFMSATDSFLKQLNWCILTYLLLVLNVNNKCY
jgi:hypothetical protein